MTDYRIVLITAPDAATAETLAQGLVEAKLAACVNVVPGIRSFYFWEGKLNKDNELLLLVKTRVPLLEELVGFVKQRHPYTVPEIVSVPILEGLPAYLEFLERGTKRRT